jgi:hypothetical protein
MTESQKYYLNQFGNQLPLEEIVKHTGLTATQVKRYLKKNKPAEAAQSEAVSQAGYQVQSGNPDAPERFGSLAMTQAASHQGDNIRKGSNNPKYHDSVHIIRQKK